MQMNTISLDGMLRLSLMGGQARAFLCQSTRMVQEARDKGMLVDATCGRRTRAVIVCDSQHVVLSAVQPETVAHRVEDDDDVEVKTEKEKEDEEEA